MIYLDSAATTFQKPPAVGRAMTEALASMSSPGRGWHPLAMRAADTAFRCRTELAELFGLDGPENVAFTLNATHALNIAIKSLVPPRRTGGDLRIRAQRRHPTADGPKSQGVRSRRTAVRSGGSNPGL